MARVRVAGEVYLDTKLAGHWLRQIVSYAPQHDLLLPSLSVRETVAFSAILRIPNEENVLISRKDSKDSGGKDSSTKKPTHRATRDSISNMFSRQGVERSTRQTNYMKLVDQVLKDVGLSHVAHVLVGSTSSSQKGISGGERKRLSIAVEIVTRPHILMMDEPTSGLDSYTAEHILSTISAYAKKNNRIVIASIHQPSNKVFESFDKITILHRGECVFTGPREELPQFMFTCGVSCPPGNNIAEFLLNALSERKLRERMILEFAAQHADSKISNAVHELETVMSSDSLREEDEEDLREEEEEEEEEEKKDGNVIKNKDVKVKIHTTAAVTRSVAFDEWLTDANKRWDYTAPLPLQFSMLFRRGALHLFREQSLLRSHILAAIVAGLCVGLIFLNVDLSLAGFQNRLGALFFTLCFFVFTSYSALEALISQRQLFFREASQSMYSTSTYFLTTQVLDSVFLRIIPAAVFAGIAYPMIGLQESTEKFGYFFGSLCLANIVSGLIE